MTIWEGALYFSKEAPHIIGRLVIAGEAYEIVGVKRSEIRADLTVRRIDEHEPIQMDIFHGSGDSGR